jgi:hypothetical protein
MTESRKPRRWGLWIAVAMVTLLAVYLMSYGPFLYVQFDGRMPGTINTWVLAHEETVVYLPILWFRNSLPDWISRPYEWYLSFWIPV